MTDAGDHRGNVAPFPEAADADLPPEPGNRQKSPLATASLKEATRRKALAQHAEKLLLKGGQMSSEQCFVMARNLRDYVYGLVDDRLLTVRDLSNKVFNRPEVRAIQLYVLPKGVVTRDQFAADHPNRKLAAKSKNYLRVALAAADIAGDDRDTAILALARDTRCWPGAELIADDRRQAANEVVGLLDTAAKRLSRVFPLDRYFDLIEQHEVLPQLQGEMVVCDTTHEFNWFDYLAIPSARIASRWISPPGVSVVVAVSEMPEGMNGNIDFDQVYRTGRTFRAQVNRREVFSLGIGRLAGAVGPVGVYSQEIVLAHGCDYEVVQQAGTDRLIPGWHPCIVKIGSSLKRAAWQLTEALLDPPDENEDREGPPDIRIVPLTADWLLSDHGTRWLVKINGRGGGGGWQMLAGLTHSRLGGAESLPSIIERGLSYDTDKYGPITEMRTVYERNVAALMEWKELASAEIQARLGSVEARLNKSFEIDGG
ncbi:hypothetical protein [Methylobacterium fujisawaense]|jgi:hypothetical protein